MATVTGSVPDMAAIARMAGDAMEEWLRDYEGYRGIIVLTDQEGERARLITFWETAEDEERARRSRAAMRDQVVATAGMAVEGTEVYEVPVLDLPASPAA
jgi:heme-degrading monooxygenase HmoA